MKKLFLILLPLFLAPLWHVSAQTPAPQWPCDPGLTTDLKCGPDSLLGKCIATYQNSSKDLSFVITQCYGNFDPDEAGAAAQVLNKITDTINTQTSGENLPCTADESVCKNLKSCLASANSIETKLNCYNTIDPEDYVAAQEKIAGVKEQNTAPVQQTQVTTPQAPQTTGAKTLTYQPLEPLPGYTDNASGINFASFLMLAFKILLSIGAVLCVVTLVYAGISYILSEAFETKGEAKNRMKSALFGMIILLGAWLLLNTVNPTLLNFDLSSIGTNSGSNTNTGTTNTPSSPETKAAEACESGANPGTYQQKPGGGYFCKR